MTEKISVVIPALETNRFAPEGDLVAFGDLTLLEWKITQMRKVVENKQIYVSTPSEKAIAIAKRAGVNVIKRVENGELRNLIEQCANEVKENDILWTNATSPFVSAADYKSMIKEYAILDQKYDSLVAVYKIQENIMYGDRALNFNIESISERVDLEPVFKITNGCFIAKKDIYQAYGKYFGKKPYLYEVDKIASLEINSIESFEITRDLISLFIKKDLGV
ncbi:MAG: hypothetical protein KKA19_05120 [Candidatus Margulisbacteria bacterium]|nr:hypothetical protein [Candidatus Margulisiibacteriota bacterium]